jgi:hypothetical protein
MRKHEFQFRVGLRQAAYTCELESQTEQRVGKVVEHPVLASSLRKAAAQRKVDSNAHKSEDKGLTQRLLMLGTKYVLRGTSQCATYCKLSWTNG